MSRLKTNAKKKIQKALVRVEKVVIMGVRREIEKQRKWKSEVMRKQRGN